MNVEDVKAGQIVRNMKSLEYYRVRKVVDPKHGPVVLMHVKTRAPHKAGLLQMEKFEPTPSMVHAHYNFAALIGQHVRVQMSFGTSVHGVLTDITYKTLEIGDQVIEVPVEFQIDGDIFPILQVEELTLTGKVLDQ